jgi:uncharacterized protein
VLRIAPLPAERTIEPEHRFCHAFAHDNRVLAFGGALVTDKVALHLDSFLLCCTGELGRSKRESFSHALDSRLAGHGWQPTDGGAADRLWTSLGFSLRCITTGDDVVHLILTYGEPGEYTYRKVFGYVSQRLSDVNRGVRPTPTVGPGSARVAQTLSVEDLAHRLTNARVIAYTGAGISRASGVRTFEGRGALDEYVPLTERFPGLVVDRMIREPSDLVTVLGGFQASLLTAKPNSAHRALAVLERLGVVVRLVTDNFDGLHELAGSRRVASNLESAAAVPGVSGEILLVIGVSRDEHGIVQAARAEGMQVIVIDPQRPELLEPSDRWVRGRAETVVPLLSELVAGSGAGGRTVSARPFTPTGFKCFVDDVRGSRLMAAGIHGEDHWQRVARIGVEIAKAVPACDIWVVLLFAVLHDARRETDDTDVEHGPRAADLARRLRGQLFELSDARLELLEAACFAHAYGRTSRDPTVGVCWDADRLDLWRLGTRPHPRYLSTSAALDAGRIRWSRTLIERTVEWDEVWVRYEDVAQARASNVRHS